MRRWHEAIDQEIRHARRDRACELAERERRHHPFAGLREPRAEAAAERDASEEARDHHSERMNAAAKNVAEHSRP
jgi:hypothetical protein